MVDQCAHGGRHGVKDTSEHRPEARHHANGRAGRGGGGHFHTECRQAVGLMLLARVGAAVVSGRRHEDEIVEPGHEVGGFDSGLKGPAEG